MRQTWEGNWREVQDKHRRAAGGLSKSSLLHPLPSQTPSYQAELNDHNYHVKSPEPPPPTSTHLIDRAYSKPINTIIDAQYTDDTEWAVTGSRRVIENIRVRTIPLLEQR